MHVEKSSILPFSAANIYAIVTDVEAYPEFLDWCTGASQEYTEELESGAQVSLASLDISFKRLALEFTTRNVNRDAESVEMQLVTGPFSHLEGQWRFSELGDDACKVSLSMQFEFKNLLTRRLVGKVFEQLVRGQILAFEKRAQALYG